MPPSNKPLGEDVDLGPYGGGWRSSRWQTPPSLSTCVTAGPSYWLSLGQRWRCQNTLGQGVHIFVTSTEPWGLTHLNDILNSLERSWARNGNGSKHFLGNRKPIFFSIMIFPRFRDCLTPNEILLDYELKYRKAVKLKTTGKQPKNKHHEKTVTECLCGGFQVPDFLAVSCVYLSRLQ